MWKAGHHEAESYMLIKPDIANLARDLTKTITGEMPLCEPHILWPKSSVAKILLTHKIFLHIISP